MGNKDSAELTRLSKDIVNQLAAVIRTSQIHDPSNVAVLSAVNKFISIINPLIESEGSIHLELVGEYFYVNESRIKFPMEYLVNFDYLVREYKKHMLGSITFTNAVTAEDMQTFIKAFTSSSFSSDPFIALSEGVAEVKSLTVGVIRKIKEETGDFDIRKAVRRTYFNAVSFTKGVMKKIQAGEKVNVKRAKRIVGSLVDMLMEEEELLLGMTAIKDYDEYTYHHSVNVSILSMALGHKLGFQKKALLEMGIVALFHDIGKTEVPPEVLNKPSSFTEDEWNIVRRHPFWGVRAIMNMKGFDTVSIRSAIVAFEHHIHHDHTGYPKRSNPSELDLYSRIVSLADQYDSMTSSRVYMRVPMSPDKALSVMTERTGTQLDPLLLKFFINMVGVFPVGSLVMLDTKELALVFSSNTMLPDRPKVMVIMDNQGKKVQQGYILDLAEKSDDGQYKRSIIKTIDPNKYRINLAEYML
jgi:HD-GYP domain-containing protein (c-di-GMP phosphodiesterase class II)